MAGPANEKLAYSVDETAVRAGVGRDKIYSAIREGHLAARKLGRRTLILQDDLDKFLRALPALELEQPSP
jgi:excisionase family DNA binding protein